MRKSIYTPEYRLLIALLRQAREKRDLSQAEVGGFLGITASQVSKWERGDRRVDVNDARLYCNAIGLSLVDLIAEWDRQITSKS